MRSVVLGLSVWVSVGCGSKSLQADTADVGWSDATNDVSDADGTADGGDDTGGADTDPESGADTDPESGGDSGDTGAVDSIFGFSLDGATAIAGSPVGFSVFWMQGEEMTALSGYSITSDLVEDVPFDSDELVLELAGRHTLTATYTDEEGAEWTAAASLEIEAAVLDNLIVSLGAEEVVAGEANTFSTAGTDAYGNDRDVAAADLVVSPVTAVVTETDVTSTVPGPHTLTANLDGIAGEASWTVLVGSPASIALWLEHTTLESGDDTDFTVTVYDAYGNETTSEYVLTVTGGDADVDSDEIEFEEDGVFTVRVEIDGTDIHDEVTVYVDSTGPVIVVDTPERGHWTTDTRVDVQGSVTDAVSSVATVTVNDELAELIEGEFTHAVNVGFGVNVVETIAQDDDVDDAGVGNQSSDVRAVLKAKDFVSPGSLYEEGLLVRLYEGDGGIGGIEALAEDLIEESDFTSTIRGKIFDENYCVGSWSWPCYRVRGFVDSIDHDPILVELNPNAGGSGSGGYLRVKVTIPDVEVDWRVEHPLSFLARSGTINATKIVVQANLDPSVSSSGALSIDMSGLTVATEGYDFEIAGALDDILRPLGIDIGDMVRGSLETAIRSTVSSLIPSLVEDTLGDIAINQEFALADNTYSLEARIQDVYMTAKSMTFLMETRVLPDEVLGAAAAESVTGFPEYGWIYPTVRSFGTGTEIGLSTDFLNQMLFAFWRGGMFDQELTGAELGLDADTLSLISLLLPGLTELNMVTTPLLPPVLTPVDDLAVGHHELQMGDMLVQLYNGTVADDALYMEMYLSVSAPTALSAEDASAIAIEIGDPTVHVDVVYTTEAYTASAEDTEALFGSLMAGFLPEITGEALGSFPLPEFEVFSVTGVTTGMAGGDAVEGYWMLRGDLEAGP